MFVYLLKYARKGLSSGLGWASVAHSREVCECVCLLLLLEADTFGTQQDALAAFLSARFVLIYFLTSLAFARHYEANFLPSDLPAILFDPNMSSLYPLSFLGCIGVPRQASAF